MKKLKIKLFVNGPYDLSRVTADNGKYPYVNPVFLYLKKYHDMYGRTEVDWLYPELYRTSTANDISIVDECEPDIVAFAMHVWNHELNMITAERLRARYPNIKIVLGGPNLVAHKDPDFFTKHPFVDYVVYADGEKAFTKMLDHFSGIECEDEFVNIVSKDKVYPFEQLADESYYAESPIQSQADYLLEVLDYSKRQIKKFYGADILNFSMGMEFARGCMYNCTFCDWSQNLTKRVKRRKYDWKQDVDFLHKHDISISETDANFGQWPEDRVIYDYCLSLYQPGKNFKFANLNASKLKKDVIEYFLLNNIKVYDSSRVTIALQDIDETVLKYVERPSISWPDRVKMLERVKEQLTAEQYQMIQAQLILGLPGQTVESLKRTYTQILTAGLTRLDTNPWVLLANSPAADLFYQKLHKLRFSKTYNMLEKEVDVESLEQVYYEISNQVGLFDKALCIGEVITGTKTLKHHEIQAFELVARFIENTGYRYVENRSEEYLTRLVDRIYNAFIAKHVEHAKEQEPLIEKYGIVVQGYFDPVGKKFIRY